MKDIKVVVPVTARVPSELWARVFTFVPGNKSKDGARCLLPYVTVSRTWKVCEFRMNILISLCANYCYIVSGYSRAFAI
jgi:hypothetical protein